MKNCFKTNTYVIGLWAALVTGAGAAGMEPVWSLAQKEKPALLDTLKQLTAIEACHSVAGEENYILKVRVASPVALEDLLQQIRTVAGVATRTTVVLSTAYENRPPEI